MITLSNFVFSPKTNLVDELLMLYTMAMIKICYDHTSVVIDPKAVTTSATSCTMSYSNSKKMQKNSPKLIMGGTLNLFQWC
jgi:hypothetical protein